MSKINNLTEKEVEDFANNLEETNTFVWNAICSTESLIKSKVFQAYSRLSNEDRLDLLKRIAKVYKNIEHNDNEFAEPETNECYFADFEQFGRDFQNILDNID